jgi:Ca-activated chloride channel family protein
MFRFATPWMLVLLPLCAVAGWWMARRRRCGDARLRLPLVAQRLTLGASAWVRLERMLPWVRVLVLALVVVALARPQSGTRLENVSTLGVDIVVSLDISGSMRAEDFEPDHRLGVAKRTVERFVEGRPHDRIGLVVFGALAVTRCPLTLDHEMFRQFLSGVDFAPPDENRTALGMGLATAVNRMRDSAAKSKVVVLVTDGVSNTGQIGPRAAAEAARALDVTVYTVGVGSDGEVPIPLPDGMGGMRRVYTRVELDEALLEEIAAATGGRYFRATDSDSLAEIFETIDGLEKTEIESQVRVLYQELFGLVLAPALLLLLFELALAGTRLRRLP